jgi:integrase/recombinase XerD
MENRPKNCIITISHLFHNGEKQIKLDFFPENKIINSVKTISGIKWSKTHRCWYIFNNPQNLKILFKTLKGIAEFECKHFFNNSHFNKLENISKFNETHLSKKIPCPVEYIEKLKLKRYSENTIRTYKYMFIDFINFFPDKNIDEISENDIKKYQLHLVRNRNVSESHQNQSINAIKFYFEKVKHCFRKVYDLERPRHSKKLPQVLSEEEIQQIFKQVVNLKHKCILFIIYSGGLRISEVINLRINDIDSKRNLILVRNAKGKKDRVTLLSEKLIVLIFEYLNVYKPKEWLFEGQNKNEQYSVRSIDKILKSNAKKAGIRKNVTVHTLRHSFATHLLESGTDLRYIQNLLGHNSSKTTEIYTHITKKGIDKIKSPFDSLDL